jgi:hypothetical protein
LTTTGHFIEQLIWRLREETPLVISFTSTPVTASAQAAASAETQVKVVPKEALREGDPLPKATIKIDGKFGDWNGILPAFASGTMSPKDRSFAIDKVYLAVDEKNLYMRIDIMDVTPSSFFHPNNFST